MAHLSFITLPSLRLSCALFGAFSTPLAAQSARSTEISAEWRLLYATDSAGKPTRGEKATLIRAVRSGQPIRVGWKVPWRLADGTSGVLEHAASASFLTIHHSEVFAQLVPILGQAPVARAPRITLRTANPQLWYGLVSTTGELLGYFMGGDSATTVRVATEWYAPSAGLAAP